jgi:serine phosphatase RsbU (regulator of sigma subunit)/catechol 2,3-dioxygenase-like lactoylglutathione lyase family enzyme
MTTAVTILASGQSNAAQRQGLYLRVHTVNIYVREQERSLRFYLDQLGFTLAFDVRLQSGQRCVAVSPPDGTAVLTLLAPDPASEEFTLIGKPTHVVFVTDDVAAKYAEWRKRGVRFRHSPRLRRVKYEQQSSERPLLLGKHPPVWGGVFTCFEDLDRNTFELVSLDELTEAVEAQRQAAAEKAEAERRIAFELEIAREVQARLFPQALPPMPTLDYAGVCIQARQVGGDYYDFLNLGRERLGLVLADISGKGIAAALLMANLQANLRSQYAIAVDDPQRLLESVNHLFYSSTADNSFASLFFGEYDDRSQRLRYANCGHLSALVLRRDRTLERLDSTCTVIGLFRDWDCAIGECSFSPGDALALYTDGITESYNTAGEEFGEQRLIEALYRNRELTARDLLAAVIGEVQKFSAQEQYDDITLIVAKCVDGNTRGILQPA